MKKHAISLIIALSILASPLAYAEVHPGSAGNPVSKEEKVNEKEMEALRQRLEEIRAMDLKNLPKAEKKELRHEVKEIKKKMASGGVYISVGALLVIIILILLL